MYRIKKKMQRNGESFLRCQPFVRLGCAVEVLGIVNNYGYNVVHL